MSDNYERILCKDKGKYLEISFTSSLFSVIILGLYLFYAINIKGGTELESDMIVNTSIAIIFHLSLGVAMGFILGFNKKLTMNTFPLVCIAIGTIIEALYPIPVNKIPLIIVLIISWFIYSIFYLVLERSYAKKLNDAYDAKKEEEKKNAKENEDDKK